MSPPTPGPTLPAILEMLAHSTRIALGPYRSSALLERDGERFVLHALAGGVIGVSAEHDRAPEVGARVFEANGRDELVSKLLDVWSPTFGPLLAANELLFATVTGERRLLLRALRQRWEGLAIPDATAVLEGTRGLDAQQARWVAQAATECAAMVSWSCSIR